MRNLFRQVDDSPSGRVQCVNVKSNVDNPLQNINDLSLIMMYMQRTSAFRSKLCFTKIIGSPILSTCQFVHDTEKFQHPACTGWNGNRLLKSGTHKYSL